MDMMDSQHLRKIAERIIHQMSNIYEADLPYKPSCILISETYGFVYPYDTFDYMSNIWLCGEDINPFHLQLIKDIKPKRALWFSTKEPVWSSSFVTVVRYPMDIVETGPSETMFKKYKSVLSAKNSDSISDPDQKSQP